MYFVCASRDFNKVLPSSLMAKERTRLLLEIDVVERDYKVTLSEENLRASRLWAFVEERPSIAALLVDLVLTLL